MLGAYTLCLRAYAPLTADFAPAKSSGEPVWIAILAMVKAVSEVLLTSLPNFWRIAKSFMDGRFKRVSVIWKVL